MLKSEFKTERKKQREGEEEKRKRGRKAEQKKRGRTGGKTEGDRMDSSPPDTAKVYQYMQRSTTIQVDCYS